MRDRPVVPAVGRIEHRQRHRISVRWRDREAKVCQIVFARDGFFVTFPYHPDSAGVLARIVVPVVPPGEQRQVNYGGSVGFRTQHRIKYSHHVSGHCHFSEDRRIYTRVRNVSYSLEHSQRHLFTVYAQGLEHFADRRPDDDAGCFDMGDAPAPPVIRVVGRWYRHALPSNVANPITLAMTPDYIGPAMACPPQIGSPLDGYVIVLEAFVQQLLDPSARFNLLFQGGFGTEAHDPSQESSCLVLSYPGNVVDVPSSIDFGR